MWSIFNYSVKKLSNLESSFLNSDTSWKPKTPTISTKTLTMKIYFSITFLQTQSFFIVWNQKQMIFVLEKNRIMGEEIASLQKIRQNFYPGFKSYIKFHISSVTLCDLSLFNILIPTYWHQEEPSRPSEFGQSNYVFKRYVYIVAYLGIMLQASWHIPEGN